MENGAEGAGRDDDETGGHFVVPARGNGAPIRPGGHEGDGEKGPDSGSILEAESVGIQVRNSEKQAGLGVSIWNRLEAMGLGKANKRDGVGGE